MPFPVHVRRGGRPNSFTLIELLIVIAVITILAALTMAAAEAVMNKGARARANSEIQALSAGLEMYKSDNGVYAPADTFAKGTNDYASVQDDVVTGTNYEGSSILLYQALSGKTNFDDVPVAGVTKTYTSFKATQIANITPGSGNSYVQDPWGYAYGYYTGDTATPQQYPPFTGTGLFDLWSTGGTTATANSTTPGWTNTWVSNWSTQ